MYRRRKNDYVTYGIIGVLVLFLFAFGKSLMFKITSGLAFLSSKQDQPALVQETLNNPNVRYTYVKGVVDSVVSEVLDKSWFEDTDEKYMVSQMNTLQSAEEVLYSSNYYAQSKGGSYREFLKAHLNSDWRSGGLGSIINPNAAGSTFSDLKDIVKNNLV